MEAEILHHGAVSGVTGSCHELVVDAGRSVLVDCGLFQGDEASPAGARAEQLGIDFPIARIRALLVTHCHIDHVGRIPHLLGAGFQGPIYASPPSAVLLPLVLEDALAVGFTRDRTLIERFRGLLSRRIQALPYGQWTPVLPGSATGPALRVRFQPAGHILGSAYVECALEGPGARRTRVLFSGDLGGPHTPLLPAPRPPYGTDVLVLESTYGDRLHEGRRERRARLKAVVEHCFRDRGVILVPAFSIGRTQELLYELEDIIHRHGDEAAAPDLPWRDLDVIVDSPLAARFTAAYGRLRGFWDAEARQRVRAGRHPLAFEQLTTIDSHADHLRVVEALRSSGRPTVVLAASGMCAGGRIVNYLKALLGDPRTDVLFAGYQAAGTPGRQIQTYGPRGGWVLLDGERYPIRAGIHTLSGYSAHADADTLVGFVRRLRRPPREVRLVHGSPEAKSSLRARLQALLPATRVWIPG